jgi:hypothetical protein
MRLFQHQPGFGTSLGIKAVYKAKIFSKLIGGREEGISNSFYASFLWNGSVQTKQKPFRKKPQDVFSIR